MSKVGVFRFPGTNCDRDILKALATVGLSGEFIWHKDSFNIKDYTGFIIPGGFSYGDYLRSGALAARSQVIKGLREAEKAGKPILGVCNGFQILCEAQLLPGVLLKNRGLRFVDRWVGLKKVSTKGHFAKSLPDTMELPVAHGDGCYFAETETLKQVQNDDLVVLKYLQNPNGSLNDIAGIRNKNGNVMGLMPHPERAMTEWMLGPERAANLPKGTHGWGRKFFEAFA